MSKRELKERKRREKAERKKNAAQTPTFQTGGWYDDHEAFAEYDNEDSVTTITYTHPAPTNYVSEMDKKEQEWNQTQNRMHPIPAPVKRFSPDALILKVDAHLNSNLKFTPYCKSTALVHNVVTVDRAACKFINDAFDEGQKRGDSEPKEQNSKVMDTQQPSLSLKELLDKVIPRDNDHEEIHGDLQIRHGSKILDLSPSAVLELKHKIVENVNIKLNSWNTDPIGEYSLSLPDKRNYKMEEEKCQRIHTERKQQFLIDFTKICGSKCNYILSLHTGLQPRLHIRFKGRSSTRRILFRNKYKTLDSAMDHFNKKFKNLVGVRQLNTFECNFINNNCLGRIKDRIAGDEALELLFGSKEEFDQCFKVHAAESTVYPYQADENLVLTEDDTIGVVLSWYPYPSTLEAEILVVDPKDVGFTCWVLFIHGFHAQAGWNKYDTDNRLVELSLPGGELMSHDTEAFTYAVKKILDANDLKYERITLARCTESPMPDEKIILKIHQRIGRAAVCTNVWDSYSRSKVPGYDDEWFKYVKDHRNNFPFNVRLDKCIDPFEEDINVLKKEADEARVNRSTDEFPGAAFLPCRLDKNDPRLGRQRSATVTFRDVHYGSTIINYLLPISPRWDTFALSHKDKQGVKFNPFYRIRRHVPHFIRNVIDGFVRDYDEKLRSRSDRRNNQWCQFIDVCHAEQIIIEGWPMDRVQEAVKELDKQLKGTTLDCSSPDGCGKFLHWPGIAFLNYVQEKHHKSAVISLNRLNKQVIIIGDVNKCENIIKELEFFSKNRSKYTVSAKICIDEPRFLPSFKDYLGGLLEENQYKDGVIHFKGSIYDYEYVQMKLDGQQQMILENYNGRKRGNRGNEETALRSSKCPICLNRVAYSNYRLSVCGHLYCMDCLCNMIAFCIQNKELPIRCIFHRSETNSECHEFLAISDILYLLYDDNFKKYPLFFKDRLEALVNAATDYAIQNSQGQYRHCAKPGCNGIFCRDLMSRREGGNSISRCDVCRTKVCNRCLYPPHIGISCEMEAAVRESSEKSINYFLTSSRGKVQRCPGDCGGIIEKDAGCNHMQCRFCKIHFCWLCQFKSYKEPEIYGHMKDVHNGSGGGWDFLDDPGMQFPPGLPIEENIEQGGFDRDGFPAWVMIEGNRVEMNE